MFKDDGKEEEEEEEGIAPEIPPIEFAEIKTEIKTEPEELAIKVNNMTNTNDNHCSNPFQTD